jgi:hypothetical protein
MTKEVTLSVNGNPIQTDYFVAAFIDHTVSGMIESLEGTSPVQRLILSIDGEKVTINLNGGNLVPVNAFASKIMKSTINGFLAPLKGVTFPVEKVQITLDH